MIDPGRSIQELVGGGSLKQSLYPPTSRFHGIDTASVTTSDGRLVVFLRRRLVPKPERFATLDHHLVEQGDRLDRIAARRLGDPLLFWQIADANGADRPDELTERPGDRLRIPLPEGLG